MKKVIVVGDSIRGLEAIPVREGIGFGAVVAQAAQGNSEVVILSSSLEDQDAAIRTLMQTESPSALTYLPVIQEDVSLNLSHVDVHSLVHYLVTSTGIPALGFTVSTELLSKVSRACTVNELFMRVLIQMMADGEFPEAACIEVTIASQVCLSPSNHDRTQALREAVSLFNIEDLFPRHSWQIHQNESAAASYQTLAAYFVRFDDFQAALDCLKCSDQFEDSPRSLALKAFIAKGNGETLGAVANLVSSLQQYELRKKEEDKHYIRFHPRNIEVINSNLVAGLEALNRRDNSEAIECFSQAIFHFDSFYEQLGLSRER